MKLLGMVAKMLVGTLAFLVVYFILTGRVWSQEFLLHKQLAEEGVYCFTKQSAIDIANEPAESNVVLFSYMRSGDCIIAKAVVTYSRNVHEAGRQRVYEGKIGNTQVFNPTTFKAIGEKDI